MDYQAGEIFGPGCIINPVIYLYDIYLIAIQKDL
jgi:hypothetical protein